jgi:hypothetical protein
MKAVLAILIIFSILETSHSEIEVKISVDKNIYLEAEPIICTLSFINISEVVDSIGFDELEYNHIKFQTFGDKKIIYIGSFGDYIGSARFLKLAPHTSRVEKFNVLNFYIDTIVTPSINSAPGYLSAGQYKMNYNFYNRLNSIECNFIVNQPSGIDSLVFQKLMRAYQIVDGQRGTIDSSYLKRDFYYEIAKNYPESVYWGEAVYRYNIVSNFLNLIYTDTDINLEFINRFPNSYLVKPILLNLWRSIYLYEGGESAVESNMKYILENFENSIIFEVVKEQQINKDYLK